MEKIELVTPFHTIIVKVLSFEPKNTPVLGRNAREDVFFGDLLKLGCDFYELLELFSNCEAINGENINNILENIPSRRIKTQCTDKGLRQMIPHWSSSKYHSATINEICSELKKHIESNSQGVFLYNSNTKTQNKRLYNDVYILLINKSQKYFFDINRKKMYEIIDSGVSENV